MLFLYMEALTCLDVMTSSNLAGLYSASRVLLAQEYSSLSICGSFVLILTSIRASTYDKVPLSFSFIGIVSVSQVTVWSLKVMIMPHFPKRSLLIANNHIIYA
jgi:hypothetical protein